MIFDVIKPESELAPILISSPHSGTAFPEELRNGYLTGVLNEPEDTDWFVDRLYDFAPGMGITMITARYSRFVIDLNRDPGGKALYTDGRPITELVPTRTFSGHLICQSPPNAEEIQRRKEKYFDPYHHKIDELLGDLQRQFSQVLFFDAHSIRKVLPDFQPEPFPDLILGDNDKTTASPKLTEAALNILGSADFEVSHNHPFKGGFLTRSKGKPQRGIHALQLEMAQSCYMDDRQKTYNPERAGKIRDLLKNLFEKLIKETRNLK